MDSNPTLQTASMQEFSASTLCELLTQRVQADPEHRVYTFLGKSEEQEAQYTLAELHCHAMDIACHLSTIARPGSRALLAFPQGLEYIAAFFGCLYAGIIAVPTTHLRASRPTDRFTAIANDSGASIGLTDHDSLQKMQRRGNPENESIHWIAVDTLQGTTHSNWQPFAAQKSDIAFLQYTSGSTNDPKGVMVSHGNLMNNLEVIRRGFCIDKINNCDPARNAVFWLPAYHDMGLVGSILASFYTHRHSILMSPLDFIQKPLRWLQALSSYRASITGAPNFAYDLCVQKTTVQERQELDLSHLQLAFCGAEPISARILQKFADAFAPGGFNPQSFYPCYGLSEVTLMATGARGANGIRYKNVTRSALAGNRVEFAKDDHVGTTNVVNCGTTHCGHQIRIVDPDTKQLCPPSQVGEIWVCGDSVAQGYWRRETQTRIDFKASISGEESRNTYLRTGDLGFIENEDLYVTGRLKDILVIRGENNYAQDIEATATDPLSFYKPGMAAAVTVDTDNREVAVLIMEMSNKNKAHFTEIINTIRAQVASQHGLNLAAIALVKPSTIPRTSSGKVQRQLCRAKYLSGGLRILHHWQQSESLGAVDKQFERNKLSEFGCYSAADKIRLTKDIENMLIEWLQQQTELSTEKIHRQQPFAELGIDSILAIELTAQMEHSLGLELSPILAWNYQTPEKMAAHLAALLIGEEVEDNEQDKSTSETGFESLLAELEAEADGRV